MLEIPNIGLGRRTYFSACGYVADKGAAAKALKKLDKCKVAKLKNLRFMMIGSPEGHFHIDVVAKDFFESQPETNCTITDLRRIVSGLDDQIITTTFRATFSVPAARLPKIARGQMIEAKVGGVSFKTTGAKLAVSGAPFHLITWWMGEEGESRVQIESKAETKIDDQYLIRGYQPLETGFEALMNEGASNG